MSSTSVEVKPGRTALLHLISSRLISKPSIHVSASGTWENFMTLLTKILEGSWPSGLEHSKLILLSVLPNTVLWSVWHRLDIFYHAVKWMSLASFASNSFDYLRLIICVLFIFQNLIVQPWLKLQSSIQVLVQSRTLYSLCYPPQPPTTYPPNTFLRF